MLRNDIALIIQNLIHHIGGIEVAAVDTGRLCPNQRQGVTVKVWPKE